MALASSQQSFLTKTLIAACPKPNNSKILRSTCFISCKAKHTQQHDTHDDYLNREKENKLAKLAVVTLAAGVLTLGSVGVGDAFAAKTGGRIGGQAFRSSAPRPSSPRIRNNSRTNIYINPPVAPPLVGGYGYGVPFYGGWGWSPFSFGPSVAIGVGGGLDLLVLFIIFGAVAAVVRRFAGPRDEEED